MRVLTFRSPTLTSQVRCIINGQARLQMMFWKEQSVLCFLVVVVAPHPPTCSSWSHHHESPPPAWLLVCTLAASRLRDNIKTCLKVWADSSGMDGNIRKAEGFYGRALKPASHLIPFLIPSRLHLDQGSVANRPPDPSVAPDSHRFTGQPDV